MTVQDFGLISSVAALRLAFSSYNFEPSVYVPDILTVFLTHTIRSCGNALNKAIKFPPRLMNLLTPLYKTNPYSAANKPSTRNPTPSFVTFLPNLYVSYWQFKLTT